MKRLGEGTGGAMWDGDKRNFQWAIVAGKGKVNEIIWGEDLPFSRC